MTPFFSIIIPLYNKEKHIQKTLESVLNQSFKDFEVIIVNDGSTDNSLSIIEPFNDARIKILSQENKGVSAARNNGIKNAIATYIAFLDADDYWYNNHLETLHKHIIENPSCFVFATICEIEKTHDIIKPSFSVKFNTEFEKTNFFNASFKRSILTMQTIVIDKNIIEKTGYFNLKFQNGEDTEWFIKIGLLYPIGFINKVTARHNLVKNSLTKNTFSMVKRCDFSEFIEIEKTNNLAKKFIDINRFSLAINCKVENDFDNYYKLKNQIDFKNLSKKQQFLIQMPKFILLLLKKVKYLLEKTGIRTSAF